jgi:hypothetical protein
VINARGYLGDEILDEAEVVPAPVVVEAEVEEAGDEGPRDLRGQAIDEPVEGRAGCEALQEVLVVEDSGPDFLELLCGEIEQGLTLELLRVDPVGQALQRHLAETELLREATRVDLCVGQ